MIIDLDVPGLRYPSVALSEDGSPLYMSFRLIERAQVFHSWVTAASYFVLESSCSVG
jgi:hypothetical protein